MSECAGAQEARRFETPLERKPFSYWSQMKRDFRGNRKPMLSVVAFLALVSSGIVRANYQNNPDEVEFIPVFLKTMGAASCLVFGMGICTYMNHLRMMELQMIWGYSK